MAKIYSATNNIIITGNAFDHLYLVYDPDDNPNNQNEFIIRGGPGAFINLHAGFATSIVGNTDNHVDETTGDVVEDPFTERYFTDISSMFHGLELNNVWAFMSSHSEAVDSANLNYGPSQNSNSLVASVLNSTGVVEYADLLPNAPSNADDWIGYTNTLITVVPPSDGYLYTDGFHYQLGTIGDDTFFGADHAGQNYVFDGGNVDDILNGGPALGGTEIMDQVWGGAGEDWIRTGDGHDIVYGGADDDYVETWSGDDTIEGGDGNDTLDGLFGHDIIRGDAGDDILMGGDGNDQLFGGADNDIIYAGFGDNTIWGGTGDDTLKFATALEVTDNDNQFMDFEFGSNGDVIDLSTILENTSYDPNSSNIDDFMRFTPDTNGTSIEIKYFFGFWFHAVTIHHSGNFDSLIHRKNIMVYDNEFMRGSALDDVLSGNQYANEIEGNAGDDTLEGGGGDDTLDGGSGVDTLSYANAAGGVTAILYQSGANVTDDGDGGSDTVSNFEIFVGSGFGDTIQGTGGNDVIYGGAVSTDGLGDTDDIAGIEIVIGSDYDDAILGDLIDNSFYGRGGNDSLIGATGDDYFVGGTGNDFIRGSGGVDTVDYSSSTAGININLSSGAVSTDGLGGTDDVAGIEIVIGSDHNDVITGDNLENTLWGRLGNDTLQGSTANDLLYGEEGDDTLYGGGGLDTLDGGTDHDFLKAEGGDDRLYGGAGSNTLWGDAGADTFVFEASSAIDGQIDYIQDFDIAEGDVIDISDVLSGSYDPLSDVITDFVQITESGGNSFMFLDADGGADNFQQVARIFGVTGITDEAQLVTDGTLVV